MQNIQDEMNQQIIEFLNEVKKEPIYENIHFKYENGKMNLFESEEFLGSLKNIYTQVYGSVYAETKHYLLSTFLLIQSADDLKGYIDYLKTYTEQHSTLDDAFSQSGFGSTLLKA